MSSAGAGLAAASGLAAAFASVAAGVTAGAFLSGKPNFAARAAKTSSLIPRLADLSIAPGFSFLAGAAFVVEADAGAFEDEAGAVVLVGLGLNSRPNRSARRLRASSSGDNVFSAVDVDPSLAGVSDTVAAGAGVSCLSAKTPGRL